MSNKIESEERYKEENILNFNSLDTKIYRIFSIEHFKDLLKSKELVLVNPAKKLDDPFENFFLKTEVVLPDGIKTKLDDLQNKWYVQCWTYKKESDALWRIYSPCKNGVRVSTTARKLFDSIYNENEDLPFLRYFVGNVNYIPQKEIEDFLTGSSFWDIAAGGSNNNFAKLLCIKRPEFDHEEEVRILVNDINGNIGDGELYRIPFEIENVFDDVCLDPRYNDVEYKKIKKEIEDLGCNLPISQSQLYKLTITQIRL